MSATLFDSAELGQPGRLEQPASLAAREWFVRLFGEPEQPPVEPAEPGACDDCRAEGPRERLGRVLVCADCVARRVGVALKLASEGAGAGSERTAA